MPGIVKRLLKHLAHEHGKLAQVYRKVCNPSGLEWAEYLRRRDVFYSMGENCSIHPAAHIYDHPYIRLGNNVRIAMATLMGHDGSANMLNRAYGTKLDHVGKVDLKDNVYIGYGAIILPDVTIGPNAIVSAGSVVSRDVKEGEIVSGVPARPVGSVAMSVEILKAKNEKWPWAHLVAQRKGETDPKLEPTLMRMRQEHFFGKAK